MQWLRHLPQEYVGDKDDEKCFSCVWNVVYDFVSRKFQQGYLKKSLSKVNKMGLTASSLKWNLKWNNKDLLYPDWRTKEQTTRFQTPYQTICWQRLSGSLIATLLATLSCLRNHRKEQKTHSVSLYVETRCHQAKQKLWCESYALPRNSHHKSSSERGGFANFNFKTVPRFLSIQFLYHF